MADLFDNISAWLLQQALGEDDAATIIKGLAERLVAGGVPIARLSVGRSILHPVIGLMDTIWDADTGQVRTNNVPRETVRHNLDMNNPFADIIKKTPHRILADLTKPEEVKRYTMFADLAAQGITGYAAFGQNFGRTHALYAQISNDFRGATVSFATKRLSGFCDHDLDGFERILPALNVCLRLDIERFVAAEILGAYLGRNSGQQVLAGLVERGDGQQIECAILYSDLRGSVALSQSLDMQTYLDSVNTYFDCIVTAVSDHGGEVLKFIGDGVLAIFPFEGTVRPRGDMCAAALSSAREAFARIERANVSRAAQDLPALSFGIGLHAGTVIYGNVGTHKRLDFTASGPAVSMASRTEAMTRALNAPLIATAAFDTDCPETGQAAGAHEMRGFTDPVTLVSYPVA